MGLTYKLDILMKQKNINKAELSRESGVPYTTIDGLYKKGSENVKLSTLKRLCAYFNCSLDYLTNDNVSEARPMTISALLDENDFTADELEEILQFAEFIKNRRNHKF